ncbi:hypothetical protein KXV53_000787 [Aspergillus fumigatus]|nr:hypothetical protein KXV53_000787 [Aspergillus fumigatus]
MYHTLMLFDEFRYGDFPIPQGWRENLSAGLAATQERLIVPHSFEDAFLVLRFSFLFVQEEYVSQDGFKMRILWQAINNGPYAQGHYGINYRLVARNLLFDSMCCCWRPRIDSFTGWLKNIPRKLQGQKARPDSLVFHWGEDINLEYPSPTLPKSRSPNREASAIVYQGVVLCSTPLDSRPTSSLNGAIEQPFSYNPTPPLPVEVC